MENPLEKKRRGYLSFFCDGVIDAVAHRELDIKKNHLLITNKDMILV